MLKKAILVLSMSILMAGTTVTVSASVIEPSMPELYVGEETLLITEENKIVRQYAEDLNKMEEEKQETLSEEESLAGYQMIDGQKYTPEELIGDTSEEILFGGVKAGKETGYVNFILDVPEYIHETAQIIMINMNTGKMYGCRTQEINGHCAQICLPSGIYMISEGGLMADTTGRFYIAPKQFQVKSGSQQDLAIEVLDSMEEKSSDAYPEETQIQEENNPAQGLNESESYQISEPEPELPNEKENNFVATTALTVLFTVVPLLGILIFYQKKKEKKPFKGFDE